MDTLPPRRRLRPFASLVAFATLATAIGPASWRVSAQAAPVDLRLASLEELMDIEIVSASRRKEKIGETAAAVDVLTADDIRRSGAVTVPELLRLLPGVQVAQITSHDWAVSIRGFNDLYANKLLVLVDGRSVYNRVFSGVAWSWQNLLLEDVERIELIRGPAAASWGANAVNGVINIVTKNAGDTRGGYVTAEAGAFDAKQLAARYGGRAGAASYRVYSQWNDHGMQRSLDDRSAMDDWKRMLNGARMDWQRGEHAVTVDGDFTYGLSHTQAYAFDTPMPILPGQPARDFKDTFGFGHALAHWTRTQRNGSAFELQSYVDFGKETAAFWTYSRNAFDVDAQYHTRLFTRHDIVLGTGYRVEDEQLDGSSAYSIGEHVPALSLFSVSAQDEIALANRRVRLTIGARVEHDTIAEWGVQPTVRGIWDVTRQQHVWAAASRALRTPSLHDLYLRYNSYAEFDPATGVPVLWQLIGNTDFQTERVMSTEAGYRAEIGSHASVSATGFYSRYPNLMSFETLPYAIQYTPWVHVVVPTQMQNLNDASTAGLEISGHLAPTRAWRVDLGYTGFHLAMRADGRSNNPLAPGYDGNAPANQWTVRSLYTPTSRLELDATLFRVGALTQTEVPAYTRVDLRTHYSMSRRFAVSIVGQNLFDRLHTEFGGYEQSNYSPRTGSVRLTWRF